MRVSDRSRGQRAARARGGAGGGRVRGRGGRNGRCPRHAPGCITEQRAPGERRRVRRRRVHGAATLPPGAPSHSAPLVLTPHRGNYGYSAGIGEPPGPGFLLRWQEGWSTPAPLHGDVIQSRQDWREVIPSCRVLAQWSRCQPDQEHEILRLRGQNDKVVGVVTLPTWRSRTTQNTKY